jgi:hypothetical protein
VNAGSIIADEVFKPKDIVVPPCRFSVSWPTRGALKGSVLGQCWKAVETEDGVAQIIVTPLLVKPVEVLDTLVHESIHAVLPEAKHGKAFAKMSEVVGLIGPPKSNTASPELRLRLEEIAERLGPYPHAAPVPSQKTKGQTTRMLKIVCPKQKDLHEGGEAYILRASRKIIELGLGTCGVCGETLEVEESKGEGA